jgi:glycosyltransferase involved in cell wall biosynthesis
MMPQPIRRWIKSATIAAAKARAAVGRADISIFHDFVPPPYGGGNQFLWGLRRELERRGWRVENNSISPTTRACLYNSFNFDFERLARMRRDGCRMLHRVDGPIAAYRGVDEGIDQRIWKINHDLADVTVFQSNYSWRTHQEMGLQFRDPHVIRNAADPAIFHARDRRPFLTGPRVRLIATSWSANVNKGADVYAYLDRHLDFSRFELTFLGRAPAAFTNITTVPPVGSEGVAAQLRAHDIFVIGSRNEPCSNALIEALSCGLPAVFLDSGSHAEVVGPGGVAFRTPPEALSAIDRAVREHATLAAHVVAPRLTEVVDRYLALMGLPARPQQ